METPLADIKRVAINYSNKGYKLICVTSQVTSQGSEEISKLTFNTVTVEVPTIDWFVSFLKCANSTKTLLHYSISGSAVVVSDGYY